MDGMRYCFIDGWHKAAQGVARDPNELSLLW